MEDQGSLQRNTAGLRSSLLVMGNHRLWQGWGRMQHLWSRSSVLSRFLIIGTCLLVLVGGSVGLIVVVQHAQTKPDGYLWTSKTLVIFVQFTADGNGHLSGVWHEVSTTSDEQVNSEDASFTGVQNGSQISLTFSAFGLSYTITGTLNNETLTLQLPDQNGYLETYVLQGTSVSDYNAAVATLRQQTTMSAQATRAAQATASTQAQRDQAVLDANQRLSEDLNALTSDVHTLASATKFDAVLSAYVSEWQQMQKDYQQEQADYQNGCGVNGYNATVVNYDANTVNNDLNTIHYDDNSLTYDGYGVQNAITSVQSDIQSVDLDWQRLQVAVAADKKGSASAGFTSDEVNNALMKAQKQQDASNQALQSVQAQANQYDQEAAQMNTDAQNLANSLHC